MRAMASSASISLTSSRPYTCGRRLKTLKGLTPWFGSFAHEPAGPARRLCSPRDSSAPRSISGDAAYVGQGEITCDSTCIYDVPYRPSRPLLRGHIISQLTDGTLLSRLRLQSPKLAQSHGRQIHCIGTRLEANPNGWFWSKIKPALRAHRHGPEPGCVHRARP